jgi:endo-1,4-beta-xylanase
VTLSVIPRLPWPPAYIVALKNESSGMCLDVPGASSSDGVQIQQYPCHYGPNQQWLLQL